MCSGRRVGAVNAAGASWSVEGWEVGCDCRHGRAACEVREKGDGARLRADARRKSLGARTHHWSSAWRRRERKAGTQGVVVGARGAGQTRVACADERCHGVICADVRRARIRVRGRNRGYAESLGARAPAFVGLGDALRVKRSIEGPRPGI
jgi:hypothetical protein